MDKQSEHLVQSWNDLNDYLYDGDWDEDLRRHRPTFVYRGQADISKDLRSPLAMLGGSSEVEKHLLRNFRRYASTYAGVYESQWMWMAMGRHHGLPTRLVDCTHSPQVALHFAVSDIGSFEKDAVIWRIDYRETNQFLPRQVQALLESEGSDMLTVEMLDQLAKTLVDWDGLSKDAMLAFWEPPSLDDRIVNQYAVFALLSNRDAHLDEWLVRHPKCYSRIRVPAKLKWEIRDRLDQANVTERILFPGLDGLCMWLKRYYSPRSASGVQSSAYK